MSQNWRAYFSETLHQAFLAIKEKNPRYSLRAFAKKTSLSPASLSLLFRSTGRWKVSPETALRVFDNLGIEQSCKENLLAMMEAAKPPESPGNSPSTPQKIRFAETAPESAFRQGSDDAFEKTLWLRADEMEAVKHRINALFLEIASGRSPPPSDVTMYRLILRPQRDPN